MATGTNDRQFQALISSEPPTMLVAERLRDGRLALGTRTQLPDGDWKASELLFIDPAVQLDLVAWLTPAIETGWIDTVRHRQEAPLRTAGELYGEGPGAVTRLALDTLVEIPPALMTRAMVLLANSVGPQARQRLIERLNQTASVSEDTELRLRMADENEAFAYAIAAAALFDASSRGIYPEDL